MPDSKTEQPAQPLRSDVQAQYHELGKGMEAIRGLLQRVGAALGAVGVAVLSGLGYTQLHKVFPLPPNHAWLIGIVAAVGLFFAVVGAVWLAQIFFSAQRRILMQTDVGSCDLDSDEERDIVSRQFATVASQNDARDLQALELRAARIGRVARRIPDGTDANRVALEVEEADLDMSIRLALRQAAALVLERRSSTAFTIRQSGRPLLCAALGIVLAFGAADYSQGERDKIGVINSCGVVVHSQAAWCLDEPARVVTMTTSTTTVVESSPPKATSTTTTASTTSTTSPSTGGG